jgi:uncharacterized protein (TIGR02145 family)
MLSDCTNISYPQNRPRQRIKHHFYRYPKLIRVFLCCFIGFYPFYGFSQGEWNNWYFGNKAGVTFTSGSPTALLNSTVVILRGGVSVSDSNGNFQFVSNGATVFNKNFNPMPNGSGLYCATGSGPGNQPVYCVKSLTDDSTFYLFSVDMIGFPFMTQTCGLTYSIINLRLNNRLGDVEPGYKQIQVPGAFLATECITATRHSNNKDVWLAVRLYSLQNKFAVYKINANGIDTIPILSNSLGKTDSTLNSDNVSWLKFSPDGNRFVCLYNKYGELCQFNKSTGSITPLFKFRANLLAPPPVYPISAEFSLDSKLLYVTFHDNSQQNFICQYNALAQDSIQFAQSQILLGTKANSFNVLQMGQDWKIYMSEYFNDSLGSISSPNIQGTAYGTVPLLGRLCYYGLPMFLQKYKVYIHHSSLCQNDSVRFWGDIWPPPDSIHWDFGDPISGSNNYSNLPDPKHLFSGAGAYTVELFVRHNDNRTDTSWQTITIVASPQVNLGSDRTICAGNSTTLDAGFCAGCSYEWKNVTTGLVVGTNQTYTTGVAGNYCVKVTNGNNCSGYDTIQLVTTPVPQLTNNPLYDTICSGETTNIPLTSIPTGANFHWTATLTSGTITGFSADSGLVISQTLVNIGSNAGIVNYHITPKVGSCTGITVDFPVTVVVGDSVKVSITASLNNICAGTSVTFTATPTNPGITPVFQWKVNSVNTGTNSPTLIYTPINGDVVQCILTSSNTVCTSNNPATSNTITMLVNPNLPVSVSVSPSLNPICAGTVVTFTATPTYGGLTPSFQWKVNGGNVGTNNNVYSYTPNNGDFITCTLTSSETCTTGNPAISNQVVMIVNPLLPVSISIAASSNPFCIGNSVTFTATPIYPGTTPVYQWKVNGLNVGTNNLSYTYNPVPGDVVTCVLTSSELCTSNNPATSNTVTMIGNLGLPAGVTITAVPNPFCPGSSVTCTAIPNNGGTNPIYQWKVNGLNVGTNSPSHTFNPLNNDSVRCIMTSNLSCVSGNPASSNKIILSGTLAPVVTFTSCFDTITTLNAKPIKLKGGVPLNGTYSGPGVNPATGVFTPITAGLGTKTITYTYTNVSLCSASKTRTILVQAVPAFTCGNSLMDIRDNKVYPTIQIGSQCWMAANLNYGSLIPGNAHQRDNCINEKYCYNDLAVNCGTQTYYQWDELMRYDDTPVQQGLCPPGWHIPTEAEWNTLFSVYTSNGFAGSPLKYSGYSGFNAMLSGVSHQNVQWDFQNFATFFWSSTSHGSYKAWAHGMNDYNPSVSFYTSLRSNAFSVRCLKD